MTLFLIGFNDQPYAFSQHRATPVRPVAGWAERVKIFPGDIIVHAKLDTGADNSSLNAAHVFEFVKEGKDRWVRFEVINRYGKKAIIEAPVLRIARIKRAGGNTQKRMVIRLKICLGKEYMEADVNLVDRSDFDFQMLIGRSFLGGNALIDPSSSFLLEPECKGVPKS
jgi:hypothetical protein